WTGLLAICIIIFIITFRSNLCHEVDRLAPCTFATVVYCAHHYFQGDSSRQVTYLELRVLACFPLFEAVRPHHLCLVPVSTIHTLKVHNGLASGKAHHFKHVALHGLGYLLRCF